MLLTPNRSFGMGHRPGPLPEFVKSIRHLFGARRGVGAVTGTADLSGYVDQIRNQAQTSRCVGAANARIINVVEQRVRNGGPSICPYPSERGLYSLAREQEGQNPLVDEGSMPGMLLQAVTSSVGVPLERDFPEDDAEINELVPAEVLAAAITCKVSAAHTIDSEGTQRVDDACQTLLEGFPFTMAIPVGAQYEGCSSQVPVGPCQGTIYGGHDIAIVGFQTVNGRRLFLNPGSWGTGFGFGGPVPGFSFGGGNFGAGGWVWLDESVLSDTRASDFVVVQVVPDFS